MSGHVGNWHQQHEFGMHEINHIRMLLLWYMFMWCWYNYMVFYDNAFKCYKGGATSQTTKTAEADTVIATPLSSRPAIAL